MSPRLIYLGSPEADAASFLERVRRQWPSLSVLATDDRAELLDQAPHAEGVIALQSHFDDTLLRRASALRWIHTLTTGTDLVLRQHALPAHVQITSMRGIHGPQMSELVFLQMLALARDFPRMLRHQAEARWERWSQALLWHKTVTIVGVGAISAALAPRCRAFGMRVLGVSATPREIEGFDAIYPRERLRDAVREADFVVLVVPHTPENDNMIDASVLAAMKREAFLVNVARGGVLDEDALLAALRAKQLAGAALDVFRQVPLPPGHPLWQEPNVIVTPLIGGMSDVYAEQAWPTLRHNIDCFQAGRWADMVNIVLRNGAKDLA